MTMLGHRKQAKVKKTYYDKKNNFDDLVLEKAGKKSSQYQSNVYEKMKKDERLETFKKLLSTASSMGYDRNNTCKYINEYMGEYFRGNGISMNTLNMLLQRYPDINEAWTVHRNNIAGAASARIYELISKTNDIELLLKVAKAFDNSGIVHDSGKSTWVPTKKTILMTEQSLGMGVPPEKEDSKETLSTLEQLKENYIALNKSDISSGLEEVGLDEPM